MLKIKYDINQQDLKRVDLSILSNLNNFHSLEVVDRVSETQLQVGENSNWIIWRLKGWKKFQAADHQFENIIELSIETDY